MLAEDRMMKIVSIVEENGSITIAELQKELNASESTVRRALNSLDSKGLITKVHGGAISKNTVFSGRDDAVNNRKEINRPDKLRIAKYAASLIKPGDFVYIDAGTTTELMVDFIEVTDVSFVTNAISHAKLLAERGYDVYLIGGRFKAVTEAIVGEESIISLDKYNFTKGFFGTNGIHTEKGFLTPDIKEAMVKSKAIENCKEKYILADNSKFNKVSNVAFADFISANVITTGLNSAKYKKMKNIIEV